MPQDEENKVFDVSKPNKVGPSDTSRPIIVGHHPTMGDPMMKDNGPDTPKPIHIAFDEKDDSQETSHATSLDSPPISTEGSSSEPATDPWLAPHEPQEQAPLHPHEESPDTSYEPPHNEQKTNDSEESHFTSLNSLLSGSDKDNNKRVDSDIPPPPTPGTVHSPTEAPLPIPRGAGPYRRWPRIIGWISLVLLIVAIGGFLAIDLGLVKSDIKLPFHIFNKQKTSAVVTPLAPPPVAGKTVTPPAPSVPAGFTAYKLAATNLNFAYPMAWGTPSVTADLGFSKRGGTNKSDGTHAYVIKFATNKDVELAVTSSKYLPASRKSQYYDFLQWCTGTNDGKFYKETLLFSTQNKVDTPSTVTCDQGPLTDTTKLDEQTILQPKTKDGGITAIGDLYTKNLSDESLTVLRVKDTTSANSENIKKLLETVKVSS